MSLWSKRVAKRLIPLRLWSLLRLCSRPGDRRAIATFLRRQDLRVRSVARMRLLSRMAWITEHVQCAHTEAEMLEILSALLFVPPDQPGVVVEAGCFKGGSAAKLSIGARLTNRSLHLFDSFTGIPENLERDEDGRLAWRTGSWSGSETEVRRNIARYGEMSGCSFHRGLFQDTLKDFHEPIAVAFLDVDLAASTRTCLKYLYPKITEGGVLFSHDGYQPLVRAIFADTGFWEQEVGCRMPTVEGLGARKLLRIVKTSEGP